MAHFADLTPYSYVRADRSVCDVKSTVNIGWLDASIPYNKGETPAVFREKLRKLYFSSKIVNLHMGGHDCPFCPEPIWDGNSVRYAYDPFLRCGGRVAEMGNGELRVAGTSRIYAAPTLIYHFVTAHDYRPPDEFIDAVIATTAE
jgi:hypothetical protein